jgi:hypothetical protein
MLASSLRRGIYLASLKWVHGGPQNYSSRSIYQQDQGYGQGREPDRHHLCVKWPDVFFIVNANQLGFGNVIL